jgi:carboxyl-terminal processing protease
MKRIAKLLPPIALVGALALVPVTASSFAAADTTNYQELEKFMSVYERVKANYVEPGCSPRSIRIPPMPRAPTSTS